MTKGAYILKDCDGTPAVILIGTGSEVQYVVEANARRGILRRVVSMPCREWFDEQDQGYKDFVIPPEIRARVSIEAGVGIGWRDLVGDAGRIISINHYGASAAESLLFEKFGFTPETVVAAAHESLDAATGTTAPTHPAASGVPQTKRPIRASRSAEAADATTIIGRTDHERTAQGPRRRRRLHLA